MAKTSYSRRQFLQTSAWGSAALAMSSCTTLDRYFMGDTRNLESEVVILGGGAAGLAAAYALKKRKVPFRVFEASSRIGGRVQTLRLFPEGEPVAELGAEFFESNHKLIFELAKEFSLTVTEIKALPLLEPHLFYFGGKTYHVKDLVPRVNTLMAPIRRVRADLFRNQDVNLTYRNATQFERSKYYDSISLKDLLDSWEREVDPIALKLVSLQAVSRFGLDAHEQSAMNFLSTLDSEGSALMAGRPSYRMQNGLTSLMNALYERVAGVIPNQVVRTQHTVEAISETASGFKITFKTPQGKETYNTRHIISTLPFTAFRKIKNWKDLDFTERKRNMIDEIGYGAHSKGVLAYPQAFWRNAIGGMRGNFGNFTGEFDSQRFWESSRGQGGNKALLTFMRAGSAAAKMGADGVDIALKDLGLFYKDLEDKKLLTSAMANWSQRPGIEGSMLAYKPGQFTRYHGVAGESEYKGRFVFAGEHTSTRFGGTLQGALESGYAAAGEVAARFNS